MPEEVVLLAVRYRFKIALPQGEQADIAAHDIVKTNAVAYGKGLPGFSRQRTELVDAQPYEGKSGMRDVEFLVRLLDDEAFHVPLTSQVMFCEVI